MAEREVEIPMQQGSSDSVLIFPDGARESAADKWPGILYLTDISGIRPATREFAARIANQGYAVLMPNIFYRTSRTPLQPSLRTLDAEGVKTRIAELAGPLTPEAMEQDNSTYIDFLAAQSSTRKGNMGVVGYCFSGKMAMSAAATRPEKIAAAASFHGAGLYTDSPNSPHLLLPRINIKARLYFGHATADRGMNEEAISKFEQALAQWGGRYESETYKDALHSWTLTDSPVYNQPQAERAFEKLMGLFRETLS